MVSKLEIKRAGWQQEKCEDIVYHIYKEDSLYLLFRDTDNNLIKISLLKDKKKVCLFRDKIKDVVELKRIMELYKI